MSKFITGKELEEAVYNIIWGADNTLLILSPYIKLDKYFKELFENHIDKHKLELIIVFGKNEGNGQSIPICICFKPIVKVIMTNLTSDYIIYLFWRL